MNTAPVHDRSVYPWLASGLFFGSLLFFGVVATTNRGQADTISYVGLGTGALLILSSFMTFLGIEFRRFALRRTIGPNGVRQSLRQGIEVAAILVLISTIWVLNGLSWWEISLIVASVLFAELAFSFRKPTNLEGEAS